MREDMFRWDVREAVSNDIQFGVNAAKVFASTLVKEEGSLDPGKFAACGTRGTALDSPQFTHTQEGRWDGYWCMSTWSLYCGEGSPALS